MYCVLFATCMVNEGEYISDDVKTWQIPAGNLLRSGALRVSARRDGHLLAA